MLEKIEKKLDFIKIRESVLSKCSSEYAKKRVEAEQISINREEIEHRLLLTDEMRLICMFETNFPSQGFIDCIDFLKPLEIISSVISLENLNKLNTFLTTYKAVIAFFNSDRSNKYPNLKEYFSVAVYYPEVSRRIDLILDKYGEIRDNASEDLFNIRKSIRDKESSISRRINAVLKKAQADGLVDDDVDISVRDGHILIPVGVSNKRKIKGIVYDESASGKTAFIEPLEVVELNNEVRELHFAEHREIVKILTQFSDFLRPYISDIINGAILVGELDFIRAKALCAIQMEAGKPIISIDNEYKLVKGRHPILENALKREKKRIVPLTFTLTPAKHILIISGPNAGGKSVCLKTAGLLQYMFQWGMLVPAAEISEFRIFEKFFVDIGDEQSIENDLSTYSSHLTNMKVLLKGADENSFVLIDEFGSGTEPTAGGAIAETILSEIESRGAFGIITTHYTNLKLYAEKSYGSVNGAMMFDTAKIEPLYKLEMGLPGNSFAFELARKIGLPENIVKQAEERAGNEFVDMEKQLRKISRNRRAWEEKLAKIKSTDKTLENVTERYQKELSEIQSIKKQILQEAKDEAQTIISEANKKIEATIKEIRESQAEKEKTKIIRKQLSDFRHNLKNNESKDEKDKKIAAKMEQLIERKKRKEERKKREEQKRLGKVAEISKESEEIVRPLQKGDKVRVKPGDIIGEVIRISGKKIGISVGNIISSVPIESVERISNREFNDSSKSVSRITERISSSIQERKLNFKLNIDIRGERLTDALDIVSRYVDDAIMLGVSQVKILHGKGNGILREEIRKYLKTVPGVASFSDEDIRYGGSGITIVNFEN